MYAHGPRRRDLLRLALETGLYVFLAFVGETLFSWMLFPFGLLADATLSVLLAAILANFLALRIYEHGGLAAIGLPWRRASWSNLVLGGLGGAGAAALVLSGPLLLHAAHFRREPAFESGLGSFLFVTVLLLCGSAGEEILFRGYGFQVLLRAFGAWIVIVPVGVIFALLHGANPHASWLGIVNTAGFGILFGYAFVRSHDIWLPMGLHFGWNVTLPLFGVNVSGLTIRLTGFTMEWTAGTLWSGGAYGPEASILTSGALLVLFAWLSKAPIRRQPSVLLDPPAGDVTCVPSPPPSFSF
jgi:CAAX protease family protein